MDTRWMLSEGRKASVNGVTEFYASSFKSETTHNDCCAGLFRACSGENGWTPSDSTHSLPRLSLTCV